MDVGASLVADAEATVLVQPGEGALDDPALAAESGSVWRVAFGDERSDAAGAELVSVGSGVVAAVGEENLRSASGSSALAPDGRDRVEEREELGDVGTVGGGQEAGSGIPHASVITWCLLPARARSTGLGPVLSPPKARAAKRSRRRRG